MPGCTELSARTVTMGKVVTTLSKVARADGSVLLMSLDKRLLHQNSKRSHAAIVHLANPLEAVGSQRVIAYFCKTNSAARRILNTPPQRGKSHNSE